GGLGVVGRRGRVRVATTIEGPPLMEYSVVAVFVYEALVERASHGRRVPSPALLAVLGTALVGSVDECIQYFLPDRVFDPVDVLFNALAAVMAVAASAALGWARRRRATR
ncbi:MAG: VanZ family protein, partial [Acidobacteria bacterium]|nr:VanZ family protein [Acidobacteriota bacterium]